MATMQPMSRIISISALPWEERRAGVKRRILWEDPATQRQALMFRIEPGAQFSCHRHLGDELIFVIEGAISDGIISDELGTVTAGNMGYRPDGCVHALSTKHGRPCWPSSPAAPSRRRSAAMRRRQRSSRSTICRGWRRGGRACARSGFGRTRLASGGRYWRTSSREPHFPHTATWVTS